MFRSARGMADRLPDDQRYWSHVHAHAASIAQRYGYRRIDTPIVEATEVFQRSVGDATDVVEKEMYSFEDRGHDRLTLRPEGTAGICRAYIEHGMATWTQPVKLFTDGAMFRYDRPQAGRYRQFHQLDFEAIGEADPSVDAEVIELGLRLYAEIGLNRVALVLNSIGDGKCRPAYIAELRRYFGEHIDALCDDCTRRLDTNPLRLLDCKKPECHRIGDNAPRSTDWLCGACADHFASVRRTLDALAIDYSLDHRLVRGLDYYTRTVFEYQPVDVGSQSALGGGGRYDGLIELLGGKPTPAIGFASGIERIILNLQKNEVAPPAEARPDAFVVALGPNARDTAIALASRLRGEGHTVLSGHGQRSAKSQFRQAAASNARYAIVLGDDEVAAGTATLKRLDEGSSRVVAQTDLSALLTEPG